VKNIYYIWDNNRKILKRIEILKVLRFVPIYGTLSDETDRIYFEFALISYER